MKVARVLVIVALIASLAVNVALYRRVLSKRVHVMINDQTYNKKGLYDQLEARYGREMTATIVRYELVTQAAKKEGVPVDDKEIAENLKLLIDTNPQAAVQFRLKPWSMEDWKQQQATNQALLNLTTKEVKATDDELRDHFIQNPGKWDKPDLVYFKVVVSPTADAAGRAKQLMEKVSDLSVIRQQLAGQANVVGVDGTWAFARKPGGKFPDAKLEEASRMPDAKSPPFTVAVIPAGREFLVLRKEKLVPGKHVTLDEVKDKVARDFKASRAVPQQEVLRKLWDTANIQTEDPGLKQDVERLLFPDRIMQGGR